MRRRNSRSLSLAWGLFLASLAAFAPKGASANDDDDDGGGPVTALASSAELASAERLMTSERWADAAVLLEPITRSEPEPSDEARQLATYDLAICLYHLGLYHVSLNVFISVSGPQDHLRHQEALRWLGALSGVLPDVDDVVREVEPYRAEHVGRLRLPEGHPLASTLYHLLGRNAWKRRAYEKAIELFDKVDTHHERYLEAQIFAGMSYTMLRKVVPAAKRFFRVIEATDGSGEGRFKDGAALRDLARLSMARLYYTSTFEGLGSVSIDSAKLRAAVKFWGQIDKESPEYAQSLMEQTWAYFMAGDYGHALGNIHTVKAPYFTAHAFPEADVMEAIVAFATCHYDDTETLVARMWKTYTPIRKSAAQAITNIDAIGGEERLFAALVDANEHRRAPPPDLAPAVAWSLPERPILRKLAKVRALDEEIARLRALPAGFQRARVGEQSFKAMTSSREIAVIEAVRLAKVRGKKRIAEIDKSLNDGVKLLFDVRAAQKARLEEPIRNEYRIASPTPTADIFKDVEHVVWPFDGEYWKDELGSYRALVISRCDR